MSAFFRTWFTRDRIEHSEVNQPPQAASEGKLYRISGQAIAALEEEFLARRTAMLGRLEAALDSTSGTNWDDLARDLHNIAGTASHFGDSDFGELARSLEHRIRFSRTHLECVEALRESWPDFSKAA